MCEGYNAAGNDDRPSLEDEFLCEYVDGTMDPVVKKVFEEYLRSNPELQEHVECLQNTRMLLCRYGCGCHAPNDLHDRLRREITCELMTSRVPFQIVLSDRFRTVATVASTMALLFLVGMIAGVSIDGSGIRAGFATEVIAVEESEKSNQRGGPQSSGQPIYPRYSAFVPLPTIRSSVLFGDRSPSQHGADSSSSIAVTQNASLVP